VGERVLLRDHPAHRDARQMKATELEVLNERPQVSRELRRRVRA
jgi:hypothetical protein